MTLADLRNLDFEKISKIPLPQRILILFGIMVVIIALFLYLSYVPKTKDLKGLKGQLVKLEAERDTKKATADNLPKFKKEMERLNDKLMAALVKLPSLAEIDQLLIDIPVKAGESGLEITSFSPKGEVSRGFYAEVPINVDVSGRYLDIASFFNRLADLKRIVHVGNITLKPGEQKGKEVVLKSNVTVTTYRFVERTTTPEGGT